MRDLVILSAAAALLLPSYARAQEPTPGGLPIQLTLSGHFEAPLGPTAAERGIKSIGEQIDAKRAADAARAQVSPVFDLPVWRFFPTDPAHTLNSRVVSDDDPFFTPDYLKVTARQMDYQLNEAEKTGLQLFK